MARQRCVMSAMLGQLDPQTVLLRFQDIASASTGVVSTDIPESHLGDFVDLALKAKSQTITSVQLVPPAINTGNPDFGVTRSMVELGVASSRDGNAAGATSPASSRSDHSSQPSVATPDASGSQAAASAPVNLGSVCAG